MKKFVLMHMHLLGMCITANAMVNSILPQTATYTQNNHITGKVALDFAQNLHTQVHFNAGFKEYQKILRNTLREDGAKDAIRAIQIAAPLFQEITSDSFLWCLHAHVNQQKYAQLRGVYTTLWTGLGESGWFLWSDECLSTLEKLNQTKRILYVAGGTDITALLSKGIYNIDIIDPLPSSQDRYYTKTYQWLTGIDLKSKDGDSFSEDFNNEKITFTRRSNTDNPSRCEWHIYNQTSKKEGSLSFIRRTIEQQDLLSSSQVVVSYNELIFLCLPHSLGGWHIDIKKFPPNRLIYVKQLDKPLTIEMLLNLRILLSMSL
ncbi:hypothetical protein FJ364_02430, partial [Candidatus Dependentiae bacterium]|nr:hypothetical protein [Candidatus Dependentiae bacterium]